MANKLPIIKNIGYMWHRRFVNWDSVALIGNSENNDSSVDFAYQAGIYSLYNHNSECVYVGQTGRGDNSGLFHRLQYHAIKGELFCMWERFSWFGFYSVDTLNSKNDDDFNKEFKDGVTSDYNEIMNVIESIIVRVHLPKFNMNKGSLKKNKDTGKIEWYYQKAEQEERISEYEKLKYK